MYTTVWIISSWFSAIFADRRADDRKVLPKSTKSR
jgi:hypothetical protein